MELISCCWPWDSSGLKRLVTNKAYFPFPLPSLGALCCEILLFLSFTLCIHPECHIAFGFPSCPESTAVGHDEEPEDSLLLGFYRFDLLSFPFPFRRLLTNWDWNETTDRTSKPNMAASRPTSKGSLQLGIADADNLWWCGQSLKADKQLRKLTNFSVIPLLPPKETKNL